MTRKTAKPAAKPARKRAAKRAAARTTAEDNQQPADDRVIIKRYGNRRLYNTETGTYVTYQDLI
ncbi:MAG TPA: polyhydroxyalkanoate synthesis regulator DNA-binding domain-containing protein, partial [Blastocatellia bacterium]